MQMFVTFGATAVMYFFGHLGVYLTLCRAWVLGACCEIAHFCLFMMDKKYRLH